MVKALEYFRRKNNKDVSFVSEKFAIPVVSMALYTYERKSGVSLVSRFNGIGCISRQTDVVSLA